MKHFFNDTVTIYEEQTTDEYGKQTWGDGTAVKGRFVERNKVLYNAKGEAIMSDALLHLPNDTSISVGSKITFDSVDYRVLKLSKPKDQGAVRFIKVFLGKFNV